MKDLTIKIGGWNETSLVDVIENVSFTIWFNFCNFKCPWCSNYHIVSGQVSKAVRISEILEAIKMNKDFIDYVHITGGEPTLQEEGLFHLVKLIKEKLNLRVSIDTNASRFEIIKRISPFIDHIAIDVKAPLSNPQKYAKVIGLKYNEKLEKLIFEIRKCIDFAIENIKFVELRTTVVPNLINVKDIEVISNDLKQIISKSNNRVVYVIQQFIPYKTIANETYRKMPPTSESTLLACAKRAKEILGTEIYIRCLSKGTLKI